MFDYRDFARKNSSKRSTRIKLDDSCTLTIKDMSNERSVSSLVAVARASDDAKFTCKRDADSIVVESATVYSESAAVMIENRFAEELSEEKKARKENVQKAANDKTTK